MPAATTLYDLAPRDLRRDVYFLPDFLALHARPDPVDRLEMAGFLQTAAVRRIPGRDLEDLETPWGYGGPVADDGDSLAAGLAAWRARQRAAGRVAELVRVHPFLAPEPLAPLCDRWFLDRQTVLVDLVEPAETRRGRYNKGTRHALRHAERQLSVRALAASEAPVAAALYRAAMDRNRALAGYYLDDAVFDGLLAAPWCTTFVAERQGKAVAFCCFLSSTQALAHYHLAGGTDEARDTDANYLLLETAITHYAAAGCRWLHLGGGRTAAEGDSLLAFKAKFSPVRAAFHVGGLVHRPDLYASLGGRSERILGYRDPPLTDARSR